MSCRILLQVSISVKGESMNYYGENNGEVHFISLCEVMPSIGEVKAKRLADLNSNGEWERFEYDQGRSAYYGNRPVIFLKDGPDQPGTVGVWEWYARPNNNDTSKDYIDARFRPDIVPIEIIELRVGTTSEEIADALKKGIAGFERRTPKVFFAVRETKYMTGILCGEDMLQKTASLVRLSGNVKRVEEYFFMTSDFVYPENNKTYLKKLNPGKCHRSFLVKVFFATPKWRKLQSKNGECCISKREKVAVTFSGPGGAGRPLQTFC